MIIFYKINSMSQENSSHKFKAIFENWQENLKQLKQKDINTYDPALAKQEHKISIANEFEKKLEEKKHATKELMLEKDESMQELWKEELAKLEAQIGSMESSIMQLLLPDKQENVIMEIRAGEGGEEASLFAMELSNMYAKLAKKKNWEWKTFSLSFSETGGLKEGIFEASGKNVWAMLYLESGVHCVKRVPRTEKKGRIHTSTATVATLIEPDDVQVDMQEKDLKIDFFRSSGPGGQSVNTTDSAVRITHIPTGIVVSQQDEKSQHKNREKAMKILKARIYQHKLEQIQQEQAGKRKEAVGKGKRNERIRTYHFLQNWVKDDRLDDTTCHNVTSFMEADALDGFIDQLTWIYISQTICEEE